MNVDDEAERVRPLQSNLPQRRESHDAHFQRPRLRRASLTANPALWRIHRRTLSTRLVLWRTTSPHLWRIGDDATATTRSLFVLPVRPCMMMMIAVRDKALFLSTNHCNMNKWSVCGLGLVQDSNMDSLSAFSLIPVIAYLRLRLCTQRLKETHTAA